MARGYWPGCFMPQGGLRVLAWLDSPRYIPVVLAWLLDAPGWPGGTDLADKRHQVGLGILACMLQPTGGTGLAATALSKAWVYWPCCYRPQVGLGVLTWLLQSPSWLVGTGLASTALSISLGYWSGCYMPQDGLGILAWLLQAPGWPWGTCLAATGSRLAWGYWPGRYSPQGVLAWLLQSQ